LEFILVLTSFVARLDPKLGFEFLVDVTEKQLLDHAMYGGLVLRNAVQENDLESFLALESFVNHVPGHFPGLVNRVIRNCHAAALHVLEIAAAFFRAPLDAMYDFSYERVTATFVSINSAESRAARRWRTVWSHLTSHNAPWDREGSVHHSKRDSCATGSFCSFRQKINQHFDLHTEASQIRNSGKVGAVVTKPKGEPHPLELQEEFRIERLMTIIPCQVIKVTGAKKTTFGMHEEIIKIGNKIYSIHDIDFIFWRREKFQLTGIEIFFRTGKSILIDFLKIESRLMINTIQKRMTRKGAVVQKIPSPEFIQQLGIIQNWATGRLSNFDYLMWLNNLGSRSFHDPSQYPIFPWVLSDYKSERLDLKNPEVFRDFTKPIGAIGSQRLAELIKLFQDALDFGDRPSLFSSYVSYPLMLLLYLIRMEPFTSLHIDLQGGRFDNSHRVFSSIPNCWTSVTTQLNDYRELIPEFFFDPELLLNPNGFDLGEVHGRSISEVELPPWADSAMAFVYLNRKALESEHVSKHIHHWIDLTFGYTQKGEEAKLANNQYKYEIYDDVWLTETDHSDRRRREIEIIIEQIGQVPPQLFFSPHPSRELPVPKTHLDQHVVVNLSSDSCLFGAFFDLTNQLIILDSSGSIQRCHVVFSPSLEVQLEVIVPKSELPKDFGSFVKLSDAQFAALCNQDLACVLIDLECECHNLTNIRRKITSISSCDEIVALSFTDGRTHGYSTVQRGTELFSIPTYRNSIMCNCLSKRFGIVVSGTDDRCLIIASIHNGSTIRVVKLDSIPCKVVVTPNWGFIVVNGVDYVNGKPQYSLALFNVNGLLIRTVRFPHPVDMWTSATGFDFMLLSTERGSLSEFEIFFMEISASVYRCCAKLVGLDYGIASNITVAVTGDEKMHMIRFLARAIEKYL
jgi:hypothetical protein